MPCCVIRSCGNHSRFCNKSTGITFHRFPKNPEQRNTWIQFVNRHKWEPSQFSVICSKHFLEKYIDRTSSLLVKLRANAIPTIGGGFQATEYKMPRNCLYCGMYGQAGNSNLSLHQFPVDISRRKSWFSALDTEYDDRRFIYLCCNHFSSNDFELLPTGLLKLKKTAIPCVAGFSSKFLTVSISEDECSDLEKNPKNKLGQSVPKDYYERMKKREMQSPEVNVQAKKICSERSQFRIPVNYVQTLLDFSKDQQIQPMQHSLGVDYLSEDMAVKKGNTETCSMKSVIEVEHAYGKTSNHSENKIADENKTGRTSNISEIQIISDSETDTAEETEPTAYDSDVQIVEEEERDEKTEQEEEIIIIHSVDGSCEEQNKKDKNRIGYNNPIWLRKKIETQQTKMKFFENKNMELRCKIIDMKVSLGFKGKNIRRSDCANAADGAVNEYPGFKGMLKQAAIQKLDKNAAMKTIYKSVDELKLKKYDNAFKRWLQFCSESNVNIFQPEISDVLDFFKSLLASGAMNYQGFVIYKKAITGLLGEDKASDTRLKDFLEELNDLFHSFKRQNYTWDPHVVLLHLSQYFPNEIIGLADLSRKVVTLLALVTKVRLLSLAEIKLEDVIVSETEVQISIADHNSEIVSRSNNTIVKLPFFIETPQLCVASALAQYIEQSSGIRGLSTESLFIELEHPYNAASVTTLNRWIRESMMSAGVEFAMFSDLLANLNTLKDHQNEVLFDEIKRRVKWTDDMLIFTHFYNL